MRGSNTAAARPASWAVRPVLPVLLIPAHVMTRRQAGISRFALGWRYVGGGSRPSHEARADVVGDSARTRYASGPLRAYSGFKARLYGVALILRNFAPVCEAFPGAGYSHARLTGIGAALPRAGGNARRFVGAHPTVCRRAAHRRGVVVGYGGADGACERVSGIDAAAYCGN